MKGYYRTQVTVTLKFDALGGGTTYHAPHWFYHGARINRVAEYSVCVPLACCVVGWDVGTELMCHGE